MNTIELANASNLTTMHLSSRVNHYIEWTRKESLSQILNLISHASEQNVNTVILGEGSNSLFSENIESLVIKMGLKGIVYDENNDVTLVQASAGESWHDFVMDTVNNGLWGLENLALIPGTVGAAPIQNIGAYGYEVAEVIDTIECLNPETSEIRTVSGAECWFGYRDSRFKHEWRNHIILSVTFRLNKTGAPRLEYGALGSSHLTERSTSRDVADHIIALRTSKLPDPNAVPNSGSFFKNPVIDNETALSLKQLHPDMPQWQHDSGTKIAAGWLIEQCGMKGLESDNGLGTWHKQALVVVNRGNNTLSNLLAFSDEITIAVYSKFAIELEREPQVVS